MKDILSQFKIKGSFGIVQPFGGGHINDTFRAINSDKNGKDYLLQKINHKIFKDVDLMMNNIARITSHIRSKISSAGYSGKHETLNTVPTLEGKFYHHDKDGNYWRVFEFLKGLKSYDFVETPEQAYQGASAFGQFLVFLDDFPVDTIKETIPGFHDIVKRLKTFRSIVKKPFQARGIECKNEIGYVLSLGDQMCVIEELRNNKKIRTRVTHNDTKFNNVLLTADDVGKCVIDLDTVMPGVVHYDFGDGIRTSTGTAGEDEPDLQKIDMDMAKFKAFAEGYLDVTRDILEPIEIQFLALSGPLFSYIMGVRFLTDYLSGDHYYKTDFEGHNLQRARCQLEYTRKMLALLPDMEKVILKYAHTTTV